jgi:lipoyl(octanoyl) transferase
LQRIHVTEPAGLVVRRLGRIDYERAVAAMRAFTATRGEGQADELWLLEHPAVFTLGISSKPEHLLNPGAIPVVQSDRGGQVTYHGPGQVVVYVLVDLRRAGIGVRALVTLLEEAVIELLAGYGVTGAARADAPGVYVDGRKIASLGLRVRRGCSYHGVSLNVDMDLSPFLGINPCGYPGLEMVQLGQLTEQSTIEESAERLVRILAANLGYNSPGAASGLPAILEPPPNRKCP